MILPCKICGNQPDYQMQTYMEFWVTKKEAHIFNCKHVGGYSIFEESLQTAIEEWNKEYGKQTGQLSLF